jgi:hypothetical protein
LKEGFFNSISHPNTPPPPSQLSLLQPLSFFFRAFILNCHLSTGSEKGTHSPKLSSPPPGSPPSQTTTFQI